MHGVSFKKRAPRAIKAIKGFAEKAMVGSIFFLVLGFSCGGVETGMWGLLWLWGGLDG